MTYCLLQHFDGVRFLGPFLPASVDNGCSPTKLKKKKKKGKNSWVVHKTLWVHQQTELPTFSTPPSLGKTTSLFSTDAKNPPPQNPRSVKTSLCLTSECQQLLSQLRLQEFNILLGHTSSVSWQILDVSLDNQVNTSCLC